eukprot:CAMPEP_0117421170 /NCGR_PEP_ID=MMETSP0758-20121206/2332_1 /TAXON_ID=63605 /ORGANISM="Percolomonas cosmopolitus, Strain AE-1 (ATCC 50343)" /LENGTH=421 /DNA_ID=CAMNT_0005203167 /DNA_START=1574 /DNA_END=2839 /DNA_ORIENTATION=+
MTSNETFKDLYTLFARTLIWQILCYNYTLPDVETLLSELPYSKDELDDELAMWPEMWFDTVQEYLQNPDDLEDKMKQQKEDKIKQEEQKMKEEEERRQEEQRKKEEEEAKKKKPNIPSIENHIQGSTTIITSMEGFGADSSSDEEENAQPKPVVTEPIVQAFDEPEENSTEQVETVNDRKPVLKNEKLETTTRYFVCACLRALRTCSKAYQFDVEQNQVDLSKKYYVPTADLYSLFDGRIPFGEHAFLKKHGFDVLFIQSIQQAIYLCIDATVNMYSFKDEDGMMDEGDSDDEIEDLRMHLKELNDDWLLSTREADLLVLKHRQHAFLLTREIDFFGDISYGAKIVHQSSLAFTMGQLNGEAVRAIWSSFSQELLYFTNNDDERYSVQSHPLLLRNITIHAAEPPLGYPIFNTIETIYPFV